MVYFLGICGVLTLGWGFLTLGAAKSAMHEIYGGTLITAGAVFFVGGAIVKALRKCARNVPPEERNVPPEEASGKKKGRRCPSCGSPMPLFGKCPTCGNARR